MVGELVTGSGHNPMVFLSLSRLSSFPPSTKQALEISILPGLSTHMNPGNADQICGFLSIN